LEQIEGLSTTYIRTDRAITRGQTDPPPSWFKPLSPRRVMTTLRGVCRLA